jgi:polysaccharide pyruvyl transferase WcaK-like protein
MVMACRRAYDDLALDIVLFPQVTVRSHGRSDTDVLDRLETRLAAAGVVTHRMREDLWPEEISFLYGRARALLGTRLHSCILAACAGCPAVAIRYQGFKTEGVMRGLGLSRHVHDINSVTSDALFASIGQVVTTRSALSAPLGPIVSEYRRELTTLICDEVEAVVGGGRSSVMTSPGAGAIASAP